jgi:hypothetical protein
MSTKCHVDQRHSYPQLLYSLYSRNMNSKGKYVVRLKKFVERQMVDKFLSKNFRRHSTSSTDHLIVWNEIVGVG